MISGFECCETKNYQYTYGTAGFRDNASVLDTVLFTTGIVAALRSLSHHGKYIGVMITASHNPPCDNGVKIVEIDGSMLLQSWESVATDFANTASNESVERLESLLNEHKMKYSANDVTPNLVVAYDSRESSLRLLECLKKGAENLSANIVDLGMITTPQLHYLTNKLNQDSMNKKLVEVGDYNTWISNIWSELMQLHNIKNFKPENLIVDTANGVGAHAMQTLIGENYLDSNFAQNITLINNFFDKPDLLNVNCGADYVKTNQKLPNGIPQDENLVDQSTKLYCSFDGDADRIVFYYISNDNKFHLLDGDKISTLFALFISKLLNETHLNEKISMGVVQTAYANGNSTNYIQQNLKIPVTIAKTGVKHLHHEAITNYDIGIYFEANGHGTIIFSDKFTEIIDKALANDKNSKSLETLKLFSQLINQTVGDAISDMFGVLAVLAVLNLKPESWDKEYTDLPNLLTKVVVPDRSVFETTDQERKLVSPKGLQLEIDNAVNQFKQGRSFVRASGTENAVRVYAESSTAKDTKDLSDKVTKLVIDATS